MHLSNLTLFGFKSFIDRLTIDFQPGITALVGPNGCGKSNVVDAIRWVLGEQSPKALRGDRMEDLIFAGNSHRKAVGMAEVSFTLSDVNGQLAVPYAEVTITRRLYRSGESEYLLNQVPCRLKDITNLFLDTGLGREPYAIIEQGAIGSLLASKPADLRALLEEAAGVMSYKVRRKTALSRLEAADQNLLRVKDVLQEIERQQNSLHRQAKKAERYQRIALRLKEIQVLLFRKEDRRLQKDLSAVIQQEKQVAEAQEVCQLRISQEETALETGRLQDLDLEKRITAAQESLYSLRAQRQREEGELRSREESVRDLNQRGNEHRLALADLAERLNRLREDLEADAELGRSTEAEMEMLLQQIGDASAALSSIEGDVLQKEDALTGHKQELLAVTDRLVSQRNHSTTLTERHRLLGQERETLERHLASCREEANTVAIREQELAIHLEGVERRITDLTGEREGLSREMAGLQGEQDTLNGRRAAIREELTGLESRLHSLQELETSLDGLNEGQQFLLRGKTDGVAICQAIEGPLSNFVRVEAAWEKAVEALLGDLQQGLVTGTTADALSLLRYLQEDGTGWVTLLPRQAEWLVEDEKVPHLGETTAEMVASLDHEIAQRVAGRARDLVQAPPTLQPLLHALLGDAVVVQDLSTAVTLLRSLPHPLRVATASGVVLSSRGSIHGGKITAVSLLSRKRELDELPAVIARMTEQLHAVESEWERVQERLSQRRLAITSHEYTLKDVEDGRRELERSLAEARAVASRLARQMELLTSEQADVERELGDLVEALADIQQDLGELSRQEERYKADLADHDRQVNLLRMRHHELQREMAELKARSISLQERKDALARSMDRLGSDLTRERKREAEIRDEEEEGRSREARLAEEIVALQQSLGVLQQREIAEVHAVQELQAQRDRLRQTLVAHEEALRVARREMTALQQQQASVATKQATLTTERSLLQKRLEEEVSEGCEVWSTSHEEDPLQDAVALEQEQEELRQKMSAMGPINMAALEEYEALSERFHFLTGQAEDLTASVTSLKSTIVEINQTIKQRFEHTVNTINSHLNRFWQRLFSGGEAALVLSQGAETEEPGVEICVRVPGKQTTLLSLLSGGEKSIGAIALLMALWAVRPSPFVILDEVDAALDEQNVDRFVSLLLELAGLSQFILITHNPRTIEVANLLYGITMEEPGVSKLISVRLGRQAEEKVSASVH